jgi:hypothetical protein
MIRLIRALQSEALKTRRSAALGLVLLSAGFVPSLILVARFFHRASLPALYRGNELWLTLWKQSNQALAVFLLPMLTILVTSLMVQIEYRNNAWKQVHASPQPLLCIFAAKLLVILTAILAFLILHNLGIYLVGMIPAVIYKNVSFPSGRFPFALYADRGLSLFVAALPIVALQYALALHFRNFMTPIGIGMGLWIAAVGCLGWRYIYFIPYGYSAMEFLSVTGERSFPSLPMRLPLLSLGFFGLLVLSGFLVYSTESDRG